MENHHHAVDLERQSHYMGQSPERDEHHRVLVDDLNNIMNFDE